MTHRPFRRIVSFSKPLALVLFTATLMPLALADVNPHPRMIRDPDLSKTQIVFRYADDLWLVPREGGLATPLASPPGSESSPQFGPEGKAIVFSGNYDGNSDLYKISTDGGVPQRLTWHPAPERLTDWTKDGDLIFYSFRQSMGPRVTQLFRMSSEGGMPVRLPVPYGAKASISPDGNWLAYTPYDRDSRTWKRYQGGMQTDIWLFNLETHEFRVAADSAGTDSEPMWHGKQLYYLSDAGPAHRRNVWVVDPFGGNQSRQVTRFKKQDIRYLSMGPGPKGQGEIVLQNGAKLFLLDLASEKLTEVKVRIPGARPTLRAHRVDASKRLNSYSLSPSAKRVALIGRGDLWTAPAEHGSPRNLSRTSGVYERGATWSPDGRSIAYFADEGEQYELFITPSDGKGDTKQLTKDGQRFRTNIDWSPDSKKIVIQDNAGRIELVDVESGKKTEIVDSPGRENPAISWSADSRFIAYSLAGEGLRNSSIWIYDVEKAKARQLSSELFNDTQPTFDRKGEYLFFASNRHFSPSYGDLAADFIYAGTDMLLVVPLKADQASPFAAKSDEESFDDDGKADEKQDKKTDDKQDKKDKKDKGKTKDKKKGDKDDSSEDAKKDKKDEAPKFEIDFDGFEKRAMAIPVDPGNFGHLAVNDKGQLIYARFPARGSGDKPAIKLFDLSDDEKKEKDVAKDAGGFELSADGKNMLVLKHGSAFIQKAAAGAEKDAKKIITDGMTTLIDPREEWRQIIWDVWRLERSYFYDPNMHEVDWDGVRDRTLAMLPDAATRADVDFLIREMIAELNIGHAYYRPAPPEHKSPRMSVGMLGVDFALENGAYRITKIYEGGPWDVDARGPLSQPGIKASEGDYLLAVNGVPVDVSKEPWAAFQGLVGHPIILTLSEKPTPGDEAREIIVEPLRSEFSLRFRSWIEANRAYVEKATDGQVGYIYVPDTGIRGQNELVRQYYGQLRKKALIIDERWNGGGQIPTRFIELLNRPVTNYWALRNSDSWIWPADAHHGPKTMLINGLAGSGGDAFPFYFRQAGLGPLIGRRTWGGLVGISGVPGLIDGAGVTVPAFAFYEKNGTWGIEGHGVEPDIDVLDDPSKMVDGGDPQLDRAIDEMLAAIKKNPFNPVPHPDYPDRSGMGIPVDER